MSELEPTAKLVVGVKCPRKRSVELPPDVAAELMEEYGKEKEVTAPAKVSSVTDEKENAKREAMRQLRCGADAAEICPRIVKNAERVLEARKRLNTTRSLGGTEDDVQEAEMRLAQAEKSRQRIISRVNNIREKCKDNISFTPDMDNNRLLCRFDSPLSKVRKSAPAYKETLEEVARMLLPSESEEIQK